MRAPDPGPALPATESEQLRFRPTPGAEDLQPVEFLRSVRDRSYRESQALRP